MNALELIDGVVRELRDVPDICHVVLWDSSPLRKSGQRIGLLGTAVWYGTPSRAEFVAAQIRMRSKDLLYFNPKTVRVLSPQEAIDMLERYRVSFV